MLNLDNVFVCDIEATGFLEDIESFDDFHVLSYSYIKDGEWKVGSIYKFEDVQRLVGNKDNILIIHNGIDYDIPILEKMGFVVEATIIDSLGLSWYLYPERVSHGLAAYGEFFGVPKPDVENFEGIGKEKKSIIRYFESLKN